MNKNKTPKVTVAVVSYNHSSFIVECLESIRTQNIECELLVLDDNSSDDTAAVLENYLTRYTGNAHFYHNQENKGLNWNLNFLLQKATGEFFTYISADDYMLPGRVEIHLAMLEEDTTKHLAYSNAIVIDDNSVILAQDSKDEFPWPENQHCWSDAQYALLERNWIPAASIFVRTSFLRGIGGYRKDIYFEDFELLTRAAQHTLFAWTTEQLVAVRRLESSLGATTFGQRNPKFLYAQYIAYKNFKNNPHQELQKRALYLRWNLAVRMIDLSTPWRENLRLLWDSRQGASSLVSYGKQILRLLYSARRKHMFSINNK